MYTYVTTMISVSKRGLPKTIRGSFPSRPLATDNPWQPKADVETSLLDLLPCNNVIGYVYGCMVKALHGARTLDKENGIIQRTCPTLSNSEGIAHVRNSKILI